MLRRRTKVAWWRAFSVLATLLAGGIVGAGPSSAEQPLRLEVDVDASEIRFILGGNVHVVHGSFEITSGSVLFDPATGALSGQVIADASSGTAENPKVVKRMHEEILEVSDFSDIVFTPERIELPFDSEARTELTGTFDIHGTSHTLTFPVEMIMEADLVTATTALDIPYVAWGMKDPSRFVFRSDKEVRVEIKLVGRVVPNRLESNEP